MNDNSVTIGITTYNAEESVRSALRSALNQSVEIVQIVIVDDKSTDSTMDVLAEYEGLPNVEIFQNAINSGVAVSRNEIVARARGAFIAFFDDDDVSESDRVRLQRERILDYEACFASGDPVVCHTARIQVFPDQSERIENAMGAKTGCRAPAGPAVARRTLIGEPLENSYGSCATCSQMARTEVYRMMGGFDPEFRRCEDSDLAIRLSLVGGHFVGVSAPLVKQWMTPTSDKSIETERGYNLRLLTKHRAVFDSVSQYDFTYSWITLKYNWMAGERISLASDLIKLGLRYPRKTWLRAKMALPSLNGNLAQRRFKLQH